MTEKYLREKERGIKFLKLRIDKRGYSEMDKRGRK
jgi:hypothetical protein